MDIGVTIPNHWGVRNVHDVVEIASQAEALGYASVWTMDHLLNVARVRERLEDNPYWHPMTILTAVAMRTTSVKLGTSVLVLPYHDPVGLAKYAATLDALSNGRLILGVGVGALREEFDALGVPMNRRGALTDESIAVMRDLWTNPDPSFTGGRYRFDDLKFSPVCIQQPHVPLWIGGSSEAALRRTALVGDGWHPASVTPEVFSTAVIRLRELTSEAGRDPNAIATSVRLDVDTEPDPTGRALATVRALIRDYENAGVQHLVLALTSGDVPRLRAWMEVLAAS
ncbi:MAG: TIGR03619 family F420-dependent LLM class oxidoreductase [Chromatiales bacterium]|nr:TIGR03619 family F420-dependent LLM class oxidoreductase [Chromatiales bacterium]